VSAAPTLPPRDRIVVHFAHVSYRFEERFALRDTGIACFQTWNAGETLARAAEAHVLVATGLWSPEVLERAGRLRFIQVCGAGYNQFDLDVIAARGIRLATGSGVNRNAVSDHALSLILAASRRLPEARDNQRRAHWRPMISDRAGREDELAGKTLLVYGLGAIGERIARLARAFEMRVVGFKRDAARHGGGADEVHAASAFRDWLPEADFVVLSCPLTQETSGLIDAGALAAMRTHAWLVNVARGGCVDTPALVAALRERAIAGAALDVTEPEPLPADSPLWAMDDVILTPHTAGETRSYEDNVIDLLLANLDRLWAGEAELVNGIV